MDAPAAALPESVTTHVLKDGRTAYLIGTAHVSRHSVDDVRATIAALKPDAVCVELCPARHSAMLQRDTWQQMNIFRVIREKKAAFLLAQLVLSSFYRRIGDQLGVQPGAEMLEAVRQCEQTGAALVLADRAVDITLKRVWSALSLWNKLKMMVHLLAGLFVTEKIDAQLVEDMKNKDQLESILATFTEAFPEIKRRLIDERDAVLAHNIRSAPGHTIVAVVGAGHVPGIVRSLDCAERVDQFLELPQRSRLGSLLKWSIPVGIAGLVVLGFFRGGLDHTVESIYIWVLVNGALSALGAAIALAHPLTILACFVGAPITSLNPMIAAGWVGGLVQAWVRKPTVADLENLPESIATFGGFWKNPACRILLVVVLANIGSSLGTFISGGWIFARAM
ncbi:MAG: TraB/GumN family protein [Deltaproteobacteria bacterium]|nr:TraB/GumN family protein [Deltaproteobacteria bacterium]